MLKIKLKIKGDDRKREHCKTLGANLILDECVEFLPPRTLNGTYLNHFFRKHN